MASTRVRQRPIPLGQQEIQAELSLAVTSLHPGQTFGHLGQGRGVTALSAARLLQDKLRALHLDLGAPGQGRPFGLGASLSAQVRLQLTLTPIPSGQGHTQGQVQGPPRVDHREVFAAAGQGAVQVELLPLQAQGEGGVREPAPRQQGRLGVVGLHRPGRRPQIGPGLLSLVGQGRDRSGGHAPAEGAGLDLDPPTQQQGELSFGPDHLGLGAGKVGLGPGRVDPGLAQLEITAFPGFLPLGGHLGDAPGQSRRLLSHHPSSPSARQIDAPAGRLVSHLQLQGAEPLFGRGPQQPGPIRAQPRLPKDLQLLLQPQPQDPVALVVEDHVGRPLHAQLRVVGDPAVGDGLLALGHLDPGPGPDQQRAFGLGLGHHLGG
jgi:hypothetical protein